MHLMNDLESCEQLRELLVHMHVAELKETLQFLGLSHKAFNKEELINRLVHYKKTGA